MPIKTIQQLHAHLQTAIEIEHATIPVYMYAMYSIMPDTNQEAYYVIRSVVIEEMLHMVLAANVLNAVGGRPSLNHPEFIPKYPSYLPHSSDSFLVHLLPFSPEAIDLFLRIEKPARPHALPEDDHYHTIGQFYEAIEDGIKSLTAQLGESGVFCGDVQKQISADFYYGGGEAFPVTHLESALKALKVIIDQGEGLPHSIFDGDYEIFKQNREVAHYFRFNEIRLERHYQCGDTVRSGPTGAPLKVEWDKVYPVVHDPHTRDYPLESEVRYRSQEFNRYYMRLLDQMHQAFNGSPDLLLPAVGMMYEMKYKALALIKNPFPGRPGYHAGPGFEFVDLRSAVSDQVPV